jgi:hypothetical protein
VSTETKPVKLVAGTFFQELRSMGYTPNQMIGIANELLDLVAGEIRERKNARETLPPPAEAVELRRAS